MSRPAQSITSPRHDGGGPLSGVRVLDLSAYIAGPYGCTLLADQGAEVVKVESPEGDNLRRYPSTLDKESRAFLGVNRRTAISARPVRTGRHKSAPRPQPHAGTGELRIASRPTCTRTESGSGSKYRS